MHNLYLVLYNAEYLLMPVPDRETVHRTLSPLHPILESVARDAWQEWLTTPSNAVFQYGRTRACILYEHMVRLAKTRLASHPGVASLERHESHAWLVDGRIFFRFKKGDERGLSRNYPTQAALALHDHAQHLLDIPRALRVEIVYVLDQLATEISDVLVVCRDGKQVAWTYSIAGSAETNVTPLPLSSALQQTKPRQPLVKLRATDISHDADEQQRKH